MPGFLNPKEKISVGLDIGSDSLKCVRLRLGAASAELVDFEIARIAESADHSLAQLIRSQNIKAANISLSGPSTLIRYVNFPKMESAELQQALKFEAQKHIPFPVAEVNLDCSILQPDLPDNKMLVLLAAVKKEMVDQRLKLMDEAGSRANLIDIDSLALLNDYNYNYNYAPEGDDAGHKVVALVNIGAAMTNLNILEDGIPRLSRDIHMAGAAFTQKLADVFALGLPEAEKLKISAQGQDRDKLVAAMESVVSKLGLEIRTSFDFYESQSVVSVSKILVSGGTSRFAGIRDMLAVSVGVPAEEWDPFKKISLAAGVDAEKLKNASAQLAVAAGLALRS